MTFDPTEMALLGRIGAAVTHSRHDPRADDGEGARRLPGALPAEVDPDGVLPEAERRRRAESGAQGLLRPAGPGQQRARRRAGDGAA